MGSAGTNYDAGDVLSAARLNQKSITADTGANCTADTKYAGMIFIPSSSNGSFTADVPSYIKSDATTVEDFITKTSTQTLSNKTLTSPSFSGTLGAFTLGGTVTGTGQIITGANLQDYKNYLLNRVILPIAPVFAMFNSGGGGTETVDQGTGKVRLATDTASIGNDAWIDLSNTNSIVARGDRAFELTVAVDLVTTTSVEIEVGVSDDTTPSALMTSGARHITIVYDASTSANWICRNANGTSQTSTTSSTAVTTGTHYLTIINLESSILFYVDGTLLATHNTNIPTTTAMVPLHVFIQSETTGSVKTMYFAGGLFTSDIA